MGRFTCNVLRMVTFLAGVFTTVAEAKTFVTGVTTKIYMAPNNTAPDSDSDDPVLSPNANLVVFESSASNLVSDDTNQVTDIFVRGADGVITRQNVSSAAVQANQFSRHPAVTQSDPSGCRLSTHSSSDQNK